MLLLAWAPAVFADGVVILHGGQTVTPVADVTVTNSATLVKAANGNRVALSCTNTSASVHVRWGSSAVTASAGQRVPAGSSIEIRNIGAIYMISEGANVTVSCTEETL
jgi:hypothetical protein